MPKAIGYIFGDGNWVQGGVFTNPPDQTVLADTGPLTTGSFLIAIAIAGSVTSVVDLQHRNTDNTATLKSQRRRPAAGNDDFLIGNKLLVTNGERFRVVLQGAIVGEIQVSIFYQETA